MTLLKNRTSLATTSGVALLLGALLTGCSGGASVDDFCAAQKDLAGSVSLEDGNTGDFFEKMAAIEAPDEIADDWETLTAVYDDYTKATEALGDGDTDKLMEATEMLTADDFTTASQNVADFSQENCEA
jgi:hypothetical protein